MEVWESKKNIELSLKWNNFTENIVSSLETSFGNQDFVDVTLVCEGGSIKAHRLILSACSFFFCRILKENVCPHPVIILKGITLSELETLLMYMYHGEARTNENDFPRLLEAAQFLEIRGLTSSTSSQEVLNPIKGRENTKMYTSFNSHIEEMNGLSGLRRQSRPIPSLDPVVNDGKNTDLCNSTTDFNTDIQEEEVNIKQEIDEENPFSDDIPDQIEFIQSSPVVLPQSADNITTCLVETGVSIKENLLQEQKKLAFYEPRPCPKCKRVYRDAATLRTHISIMHEVLPQKITCSCGMLFNTKHDMYAHRKKGHKR